jgi:23S rRNA (cytidine1920-2'-O)/16S rRNA (cytidine1409-2'-O)-methyltransferase
VERGLVETRHKAQALIMAGAVRVDGRRANKSGEAIKPEAALDIDAGDNYASRGAHKLEHALQTSGIDVAGLVCLDVGASTGGFTDVLLRHGARRVYAVDVGRGQLDWRLRADPRVVVMDRTNIRGVASLPEPIDVATVDVSFISLRIVLPVVAALMRPEGWLIALVKPQFEAGRGLVGKGGVIRDPSVHRAVLEELLAWCSENAIGVVGLTASPIRGPAGNIEFLLWARPNHAEVGFDATCAIDVAMASAPVG